ncbi:hypothetical protein M422DRAFT_26296 [Sphaerobolus stellatus SS14]|nr:hypothetical protein M422DRAFT_26296 [Sphaerobolus stellatus SS14]
MNTARSTVLGWSALIAGAGVSFYFAKKGIDDRRRRQAEAGTRPTQIMDWKQRIQVAEHEGQPIPQRPNEARTDNYTKSPTPKEGYQSGLFSNPTPTPTPS